MDIEDCGFGAGYNSLDSVDDRANDPTKAIAEDAEGGDRRDATDEIGVSDVSQSQRANQRIRGRRERCDGLLREQ